MAKKATANLPVSYDEELARQAEAYKSNEAASASGQFISFKGGVITYRGAQIEGNKLDVIILHSIFENAYYAQDFDPNSPQAPDCYAYGNTQEELKPHELAKHREGDDNGLCAACWANGWGSDPKGGRGKACRNTRRLAVLSAPSNLDVNHIQKSEVAFIKLPVTSVPTYSSHVMQIADILKKPPFGVITRLSTVPDQKSQFKVQFELIQEIKDKEMLMALMDRQKAAKSAIMFPYPDIEEQQPRRNAPQQRRPANRGAAPARGRNNQTQSRRKY